MNWFDQGSTLLNGSNPGAWGFPSTGASAGTPSGVDPQLLALLVQLGLLPGTSAGPSGGASASPSSGTGTLQSLAPADSASGGSATGGTSPGNPDAPSSGIAFSDMTGPQAVATNSLNNNPITGFFNSLLSGSLPGALASVPGMLGLNIGGSYGKTALGQVLSMAGVPSIGNPMFSVINALAMAGMNMSGQNAINNALSVESFDNAMANLTPSFSPTQDAINAFQGLTPSEALALAQSMTAGMAPSDPTVTSGPYAGMSSSLAGALSGMVGVGSVGNVGGRAPGAPVGAFNFDAMSCFPADTPVLLASGETKPIGRIALGDRVRCNDWHAQRDTDVPVVLIQRRIPQEALYRINGLRVTAFHTFAVGPAKWKEACLLVPGDVVLGPDGTKTVIEAVEMLSETEPVFNMRVGDTEWTASFFVQADGRFYLVHNGNGGGGGGGGGGGDGEPGPGADPGPADSSTSAAAAAAADTGPPGPAADPGPGPDTGPPSEPTDPSVNPAPAPAPSVSKRG